MDGLKEWSMTIAGIVVLGSACEVIMPDDSFRKYVRLAIGLILVMVFISPLKEFLHKGAQTEYPQLSYTSYQQREEMKDVQNDEVIRLYQKNLNSKIKGALSNRIGKTPFQVRCTVETEKPDTFGTINHVLVIMDADCNINVSQLVKECLSQDFGVNKTNVTVTYLKEKNQ